MGHAADSSPVLLFSGFLFREDSVFDQTKRELALLWGSPALESPVTPFTYSDYYEKEMGPSLKRAFIVYDVWMPPEELAQRKRESNALEDKFSQSGKRTVNIDPGYLHPAKLVLASTKDFSHRIYLGGGIYGEITLRYANGEYTPLEWTYPDYKDERTIAFLHDARRLLAAKPRERTEGRR